MTTPSFEAIDDCKSQCDANSGCAFFLYKNELSAFNTYHCALFTSCPTSSAYTDGDNVITCEMLQSIGLMCVLLAVRNCKTLFWIQTLVS